MDAAIGLMRFSASSLKGMSARKAVFLLAEVIAVVKRSHSWEWIGEWLIENGVKAKNGKLPARVLANYLSSAKKEGLVDESRVDEIASLLKNRKKVEIDIEIALTAPRKRASN